MDKVMVVVFGGDPTVLVDDVKGLEAWIVQRFGEGSRLEQTRTDRWDIYNSRGFMAKASRQEVLTVPTGLR